ncbi:hypothetical protein KIM372_05520 [Bombiscardovia nodaiensis]|uniref:Single-stranded DNA-binding protein n=1 Tax=Bombiscardovia nodaiensis TaxID=2932181 RepID=A0ABN6SCK8_9BIFI|nr:hypothetical protein KIM372_05520 [Bombiscardovia nodaiensis]
MAMHQARMTVAGFVGKDPVNIGQEGSTPVCTFRLGSTDGYYDTKTGAWRDFPTTWMTVRAFKNLATNVLQSVHKGDPVLVTGSVSTQEWTKDGAQRSSLLLTAESIGHDMTMGVSHFQRVKTGASPSGSGAGYASEPGYAASPGNGPEPWDKGEGTQSGAQVLSSDTPPDPFVPVDQADDAASNGSVEGGAKQGSLNKQKAPEMVSDAF